MIRRLVVAVAVLASVAVASPAVAAPKLTAFAFGAKVKHIVDTKDFTTAGSYHAVDVVDAIATFAGGDQDCRAYTLQLFSASTGDQVGATVKQPCSGPMLGGAHWTGVANGRYHVTMTVQPRKGEKFLLAGTVIYGVK